MWAAVRALLAPMSSRLLALWLVTWGLAVACGTDDPVSSPPLEDAGGAPSEAGAPPSEGGAGVGGDAGAAGASSGAAGAGGSVGGSGGVAASGAAPGGSAGEPADGGATIGGASTEPLGPGSPTCGAGKFATEGGCVACPALPSSHPPTLFYCASVQAAEKLEEDLTVELTGLTLHEPLGGQVSIAWSDVNQAFPDGQAEVPFEYSPQSGRFFFDLPAEARYADHWHLEAWSFADACGFVFTAPALTIDYSGAVYSCHDPD